MRYRLQARILTITMLSFLCYGCDGSPGPSTPTTPTTPPPTAALPKALNCIVGKTITITGNFYVPLSGSPIGVNREAVVTANLFKVKVTPGDEVSERDAAETRIETWEGDYVGLTLDGTHGYGYQDETQEDCYKVEYFKGPFVGPGGKQCSMSVSARICEDTCTIEDGKWEVKCGVAQDGTGGDVRAFGGWSVQ